MQLTDKLCMFCFLLLRTFPRCHAGGVCHEEPGAMKDCMYIIICKQDGRACDVELLFFTPVLLWRLCMF